MRVRKITNRHSKKLIGKFPSVKLNRIVWWESPLELDFIYLLEFDRDVISYHEQPARIYYTYDGRSRRYTPDFYVERNYVRQIIEVKPESKASTEENLALFRIASEICRVNDYYFSVATDEGIRIQPKLRNIKLLYKYARILIHPQYQLACHELFVDSSAIPLREIIRFFASRDVSEQAVYALIYWGILSVDLMQPISLNIEVTLSQQPFAARKDS